MRAKWPGVSARDASPEKVMSSCGGSGRRGATTRSMTSWNKARTSDVGPSGTKGSGRQDGSLVAPWTQTRPSVGTGAGGISAGAAGATVIGKTEMSQASKHPFFLNRQA